MRLFYIIFIYYMFEMSENERKNIVNMKNGFAVAVADLSEH